ncbi:MAG: hypothetical protein ABIK92_21515 [Pseudomonadota bacterium]
MRKFLIAFSIFFLFGCIPYSDNPITDPNKEDIDLSIVGTWFWNEGNESGYIHIGLDEKSKLLRLLMVEFNKDGNIKVSEFTGHTSLLEENKYLNLKWVRPEQDDGGGYMFVKYTVSQRSFGIAFMDNDVVGQAINDGLLNGVVKKEKWSSSVRITEEQQKLQKFILKKDKELFREMKYFPKLILPDIK